MIGILGAGLAVMEATVQGDAALAGDPEAFAMWFVLSRGFEIVFLLFSLAFLGIAADELRSSAPATPRWASALALLGAALVLLAVVRASGLRIVIRTGGHFRGRPRHFAYPQRADCACGGHRNRATLISNRKAFLGALLRILRPLR